MTPCRPPIPTVPPSLPLLRWSTRQPHGELCRFSLFAPSRPSRAHRARWIPLPSLGLLPCPTAWRNGRGHQCHAVSAGTDGWRRRLSYPGRRRHANQFASSLASSTRRHAYRDRRRPFPATSTFPCDGDSLAHGGRIQCAVIRLARARALYIYLPTPCAPNPSLSLPPLALVLLHYHFLHFGCHRSACSASACLWPELRLSKMGEGG